MTKLDSKSSIFPTCVLETPLSVIISQVATYFVASRRMNRSWFGEGVAGAFAAAGGPRAKVR
jgi:hypothetical protein